MLFKRFLDHPERNNREKLEQLTHNPEEEVDNDEKPESYTDSSELVANLQQYQQKIQPLCNIVKELMRCFPFEMYRILINQKFTTFAIRGDSWSFPKSLRECKDKFQVSLVDDALCIYCRTGTAGEWFESYVTRFKMNDFIYVLLQISRSFGLNDLVEKLHMIHNSLLEE